MNPNDPDQLGWRETLRKAKDAYASAQYPGDLADDVFARLDAAGAEGGARESDAEARPNPMSIDRPAEPSRRRDWRPLLALAAAVAVVATTWWTMRQTAPTPRIATTTPGEVPGQTVATNEVPRIDYVPQIDSVAAGNATAASAAEPEATMFSVVPAYQPMSFSLPDSLTLASIDEYSRQSESASQTNDASGEGSTHNQ